MKVNSELVLKLDLPSGLFKEDGTEAIFYLTIEEAKALIRDLTILLRQFPQE